MSAITSTATMLEWSPSSDRRMTHAEAEQWCRDMRHGGHDDWRLPTLHELQSIVDYTRRNPACDPASFPGTRSDCYWTSSPVASDPGCRWVVYFDGGFVEFNHRSDGAWVRAVRVPCAAEAAAHDAFERAGGEPPHPQPVTREEFDQLAAMVGDIANTLCRERVVDRLSQLEAMTLEKRIDALRARLDGQRIAGSDLASRVAALEKLAQASVTREQFGQLAAMVGDIANTLCRERVVERLREQSQLLASFNLPKLREECRALAAGGDLVSRVATLEKLTDLETWRELADAHAVAARALHARVRKLGSGTGGAP